MRLLVKRGNAFINDLRFTQGPVYIGRQSQSQVFLPDRTVSRQHALLFNTQNGTWMLQDMGSSNRTTVNGKPISKVQLHEGDVIGVADFTLEIHFESPAQPFSNQLPTVLEETLVDSRFDLLCSYQSTRPANLLLTLDSVCLRKFYHLNVALFGFEDENRLLTKLTELLLTQYSAYHVWAGLRETPIGPFSHSFGRNQAGKTVAREELAGKEILQQVMEEDSHILVPDWNESNPGNNAHELKQEQIRSAMCVPIMAPAGAYGVIYVDNRIDQAPFVHQDLDYLTLVSTHVAALLEHIG